MITVSSKSRYFLPKFVRSFSTQGEELQIAVPWGHISGLAFGPLEGRPVLAVHGWFDNANSFLGLAQTLPASVRLIAIDLPGHGFSSHLPIGSVYTIMNWVCLDLVCILIEIGKPYRVDFKLFGMEIVFYLGPLHGKRDKYRVHFRFSRENQKPLYD
jgi:hypothetical protein